MSVEVVESPQSYTAWLRSLRFWGTFLTLVVLTMLIVTGLVIILTRRMRRLLVLGSVAIFHPITVAGGLPTPVGRQPWCWNSAPGEVT